MEIRSAGNMNITTIGTGTNEMNISLVGTAGENLNITAPDINLTCTDVTSFLNLSAPAGVTILGGGGLFIASGVLECITAADITLITAGNVRIGSGGLLSATTEVEKFVLIDNEMSVKSGIQFLRLHNVRSIDNTIGSDGGDGRMDLSCIAQCVITSSNFSDNTKTTFAKVDANNRRFAIANNVDAIQFSMGTVGNEFNTTFLGGSNVVYSATTGNVYMSGITDLSTSTVHCGSITAANDISCSTISCNTANISSINISTMTIGGTGVTNAAFTLSTIGTASTTALTPSLMGKTFLLTGTPQNFTTAGLGAGDAGFFVYAKNVSAANINVQENGAAIGGTPTLYAATVIANASLCIIWWDGATLRMN
jgi:hypothetical protein